MQSRFLSCKRVTCTGPSKTGRASNRSDAVVPALTFLRRLPAVKRTHHPAALRVLADPVDHLPKVNSNLMPACYEDDFNTGHVLTLNSPQQLDYQLEAHASQLVVLMCKSKTCRPCKMFARKYARIAERFPEVVMLEMYGDETPETRNLMIAMQVKVTPTFQLYRDGARVETSTGINATKLLRAICDHLTPAELEQHADTIRELHMEAAEAEADAAQQLQHH